MEPEGADTATRDLPLAGLRILAVEQYGAGPFGSQLLADLGAEVIKIENPRAGGDVARAVGPHFQDGLEPSAASLFFQAFNRNKRSLTLDLGQAEGQDLFHGLVPTADAVAGNLRGDVPDRLGLTYATLGRIKPAIVCVHLSAYGRSGPRAAWPGYDFLMQAEAGHFTVTGEPGGPPTRMGLSMVDYMAGATMALALTSGILQARATGRGRDLDVNLFDSAVHDLAYLASWYLNAGHVQGQEARSAHPSLTPCQLYRTADGWIYLMCNKEKFWRQLCQRIDRPAWAEDVRFLTFPDRLRHRDQLTEMLDQALSPRSTSAWLERFAGTVPAAPLNDVGQALDNPYLRARDRIVEAEAPGGATVAGVASPIEAAGSTPRAQAGPALGADTEALLEELGHGATEIAALRVNGVI